MSCDCPESDLRVAEEVGRSQKTGKTDSLSTQRRLFLRNSKIPKFQSFLEDVLEFK